VGYAVGEVSRRQSHVPLGRLPILHGPLAGNKDLSVARLSPVFANLHRCLFVEK